MLVEAKIQKEYEEGVDRPRAWENRTVIDRPYTMVYLPEVIAEPRTDNSKHRIFLHHANASSYTVHKTNDLLRQKIVELLIHTKLQACVQSGGRSRVTLRRLQRSAYALAVLRLSVRLFYVDVLSYFSQKRLLH
ncbi:hypothetical protein EVAR_24990_1 [Eumeta japonica]|uniref:Mariner Mos1 transposase n=1 Tax=Eumeta variegata TaxID=151549 RepID=A0A4C1XKZ0_EUMVA|nr:hypothetical protein EVAR_24990_1 [Eumeta japonica]